MSVPYLKILDRGISRDLYTMLEIVDPPDWLKVGGCFTWFAAGSLKMKVLRIAPGVSPTHPDGVVVLAKPVD